MYTLKSVTRLAVALGVMLSFAAGALQDLEKPIEFFPGTIMFFKLTGPDTVQLNWKDPDDGPMPVLGEEETWVIISVQLKDGRSIGRFDYVLNDAECLGLRIDEEGPFDCNLMEVEAKKSKSVQLLYKVPKTDKFSFDITYVMNSLPPHYRAVSIDLSDPPPPVVEDAAAGGDAAGDEAAAADVAMPEGFAFAWLGDIAEGDVVLNEKIGDGVDVHSQGDYVTLVSGSDAITGATGFGLEVKRDGETMTWTPAKVALYRDKALVGVFDPATKTVSMGETGAKKELELPKPPAEAAPAPAAAAAEAAAPAEDPKPEAAAAKPKEPAKPKETAKPKPAADAGGGWGF